MLFVQPHINDHRNRVTPVARASDGLEEDNAMSADRPEDSNLSTSGQRQRRMKRVPIALVPFAACIGLISFFRVASNPRFESIHTLDVIGLMTAGAALGVAFVVLMQYFFLRIDGPDDRSGTGSS
jgi:hypothetical protein